MENILIVGGSNRTTFKKGQSWSAYKAGVITELDLNDGSMKAHVFDDSIPSYITNDQVGTVYKAATILGEKAYVCSTTEVIIYDTTTWEPINKITNRMFNDLHHVKPTNRGTLLVANTGLDNVLEIDYDGKVIKELCTCLNQEVKCFDGNTDYRNVESTKPHITHPNYVFELEGDVFSTRFKQMDAICLTNPASKPFIINEGNIHDGVIHEDKTYFTCTNGKIVIFNTITREKINTIDLNSMYESKQPLGWCRGITLLGDNKAVIGFSRLRPTKFRENVDWLSQTIGLNKKLSPLPTRIAVVDFNKMEIEQEIDLEPYNINAIFSLHTL